MEAVPPVSETLPRRDGSGRSLDSPEGQWSIGFQPVLCSHVERRSSLLARLNCAL
jgi:hypothetical protein